MQVRSDAQIDSDDDCRWDVGQRVFGAIDDYPGTIISLDDKFATFIVKWETDDFPVCYPMDTAMVRKAFPWE